MMGAESVSRPTRLPSMPSLAKGVHFESGGLARHLRDHDQRFVRDHAWRGLWLSRNEVGSAIGIGALCGMGGFWIHGHPRDRVERHG